VTETLEQCRQDLARGKIASRDLARRCFARIKDPRGEGARVFLRLFEEEALAAADSSDALRAAGRPARPLEGLPVSVKDLFDVAGSVTRAGSRVLAGHAPAERDAAAVARLRAAGAVLVGATNMSEFAMGSLGINPHYGTPLNPWDRAAARIPGGSSSGAAVSIADGMALAAVGSDTMGSVRMPAALCGVVGFKPTARRVPLEGVIPLAPSLDSIGVLSSTVAGCALVDAVLAGDAPALPQETCRRPWCSRIWTGAWRRPSTRRFPPCRAPAAASPISSSTSCASCRRSARNAVSISPRAMPGTASCSPPTARSTIR
jgi:aspartyl-tRNA(Asn)/glutamyl-tRNA(Gln) amidotransferase subunit A